jgi:farnesyl diphosphate synthase
MRYAALGSGKRLRTFFALETGRMFDLPDRPVLRAACALECVHAYSLVHDDLPAMDDDALRRGKPTVHVAFDEATAILAGDALQSLAFELLVQAPAAPAIRLAMLHELTVAAGVRGMCGGQALDIDATGRRIGLDDLQRLHALKTGALLRAAVRIGAIAAGVDAVAMTRLDAFADALGLAFQIRDDLLDIEGDSTTLGKTAGKDRAQDKATFPALIGVEASRERLDALAIAMSQALEPFGASADCLAALGRRAIARDH